MTHEDAFIGTLESYLDEYEGVTPLPDAVRDAVRAELPRTRQVGSAHGPKRFLNMTMSAPAPVRYGLVAAVVLAAVLGGAFLVGGGRIGGEPDASPSGSPSATGPASLMEPTDSGTLPVGSYYLDHPAFPARIDFDVPVGWWYWSDREQAADSTAHALLVNTDDTGAANGSAWGLTFTLVDEVRVDPCAGSAGVMDASVTESVEALTAAFSSWPGFPATSVEDVNVGGFSGKRVEITRDEGIDCEPVLFYTPSQYSFLAHFASSEPLVNQFTLLDVEGSVLVIWTTDFPGTTEFEVAGGAPPDPQGHAEDQVQLHEILESIVIQPR